MKIKRGITVRFFSVVPLQGVVAVYGWLAAGKLEPGLEIKKSVLSPPCIVYSGETQDWGMAKPQLEQPREAQAKMMAELMATRREQAGVFHHQWEQLQDQSECQIQLIESLAARIGPWTTLLRPPLLGWE